LASHVWLYRASSRWMSSVDSRRHSRSSMSCAEPLTRDCVVVASDGSILWMLPPRVVVANQAMNALSGLGRSSRAQADRLYQKARRHDARGVPRPLAQWPRPDRAADPRPTWLPVELCGEMDRRR